MLGINGTSGFFSFLLTSWTEPSPLKQIYRNIYSDFFALKLSGSLFFQLQRAANCNLNTSWTPDSHTWGLTFVCGVDVVVFCSGHHNIQGDTAGLCWPDGQDCQLTAAPVLSCLAGERLDWTAALRHVWQLDILAGEEGGGVTAAGGPCRTACSTADSWPLALPVM